MIKDEVPEIFGYGIAHKYTGKQLVTSRKVYDSKGAASGALTKAKKLQAFHVKQYGVPNYRDIDPNECVVVELVAYAPAY